MYTEKEKNEAHPFIDQMAPKEELLWLLVPKQPGLSTPLQALLYLVVLAVVGGVIGFSVMSDRSLRDAERFNIIAVVVGGTAVVIAFSLLLRGIYKLFTRNRPPERAYAVTNQRLLYRNRKTVATIPLENLPSISLFLGDGDKGTFSFGAFFPMWPDVEDAIRIKHLIDDAQKKRMQRINP